MRTRAPLVLLSVFAMSCCEFGSANKIYSTSKKRPKTPAPINYQDPSLDSQYLQTDGQHLMIASGQWGDDDDFKRMGYPEDPYRNENRYPKGQMQSGNGHSAAAFLGFLFLLNLIQDALDSFRGLGRQATVPVATQDQRVAATSAQHQRVASTITEHQKVASTTARNQKVASTTARNQKVAATTARNQKVAATTATRHQRVAATTTQELVNREADLYKKGAVKSTNFVVLRTQDKGRKTPKPPSKKLLM